ncbi:uncharacterized protein LOC128864579 [Anastrepha ludens]|uniref:uncharacterized protein LOC128864579 n=1 Tax=Anastrepha ludens TaxID=28586 RepID=UPI0023B001D2|nr:uncharacterized protein LOC128864579 [Anastrepha ludens]
MCHEICHDYKNLYLVNTIIAHKTIIQSSHNGLCNQLRRNNSYILILCRCCRANAGSHTQNLKTLFHGFELIYVLVGNIYDPTAAQSDPDRHLPSGTPTPLLRHCRV